MPHDEFDRPRGNVLEGEAAGGVGARVIRMVVDEEVLRIQVSPVPLLSSMRPGFFNVRQTGSFGLGRTMLKKSSPRARRM